MIFAFLLALAMSLADLIDVIDRLFQWITKRGAS